MSEQHWPHFSHAELQCHCGCGRSVMDERFMARLEELRMAYGKPIIVNSAYRCPNHNASVSTTGSNGPHTTGRAVDVQVSGEDAHTLMALAMHHGFTGIGVSQRGQHKSRFIHLDTLDAAPGQPRPTIWSY
ncbi:Peptidase M15A [Magnetococcus marinus MC-1]|uniref:Peptidase M15A n=1 Tax=Magnetococcus marinus (strain ATCC BAA-1437 / JCM 17883 / MC-1) TaxID=156889 RepID=A0LBB2_MAGMM|nr:D-Ala-D-Ala carboxypeptidase family metallohydrolase [Magnetococcus marinus]ABK45255.1 Peptidase M15A [Magnetococcus marinus MC-1]